MSNNPFAGNNLYPDTERTVTGPFSGSSQTVGTALTVNPAIIVFDNQSTVSVVLYWNGTAYKTFPAGEAFVLDCRANRGSQGTATIPLGTQFAIIGTGGTGTFSIAITYAG